MQVSLRRLRSRDISQVVEIEQEAFSPLWVSTQFKRDLNNRYASYFVALLDEETSAAAIQAESHRNGADEKPSLFSRIASRFGISSGEDPRPSPETFDIAGYVSVWYQGDEAHITEIAVRETLRSNGIGELLLIGSLRAAIENGSKVMTLEARVSNFIAQRLYQKYDFKSVGIRKGYYSDNREDAVIMTTSPIDTDEYARMFENLQSAYTSRWGEICIDDTQPAGK